MIRMSRWENEGRLPGAGDGAAGGRGKEGIDMCGFEPCSSEITASEITERSRAKPNAMRLRAMVKRAGADASDYVISVAGFVSIS